MNIIDVLNDKIDRAILRSKTEEFNPLIETSETIKTQIKVFNILILPIIIICCGFLVNILRIRKKKKNKAVICLKKGDPHMKKYIEYIVLISIILVLSTILYLDKSNKIHYKLPSIPKIEKKGY